MKKMFAALITLTIMALVWMPQNSNAFTPDHQIHFASDIGTHQTVTTVNFESASPVISMVYASHEAEPVQYRLRTAPKLSTHSKYFNSTFSCGKCLMNGTSFGWRHTTIKQPNS